MKVGLNLMFLADAAGGAGRYAFELAPALLEAEPELKLTAFVNRDAPAALRAQPWAGDVEWVELPVRFSNRTHLLGQAGGASLRGAPAAARRAPQPRERRPARHARSRPRRDDARPDLAAPKGGLGNAGRSADDGRPDARSRPGPRTA